MFNFLLSHSQYSQQKQSKRYKPVVNSMIWMFLYVTPRKFVLPDGRMIELFKRYKIPF